MNTNQDLQASYGILSLLEESNSSAEHILDNLPGIFVIVNEKGEVLRSNREFQRTLGLEDGDEALRINISTLFAEGNAPIFHEKIQKDYSPGSRIEFELNIQNSEKQSKPYLWFISPIRTESSGEGKLLSIIGEDISELREKEKSLIEIFSNIPLGIFTIDSTGIISKGHSAYLEEMLGQNQISGRSIKEVIFDPAKKNMSRNELEGVKNLLASLKLDFLAYDVVKDSFPKEIFFPLAISEHGGKWLGLSYQPVFVDGTIKKLFITIEDRTSIVLATQEKQKSLMIENQNLARVVQLKSHAFYALDLLISDLCKAIEFLEQLYIGKAPPSSFLHSVIEIEDKSKVGGFEFLSQKANGLMKALTDSKFDNTYTDSIMSTYKEVAEEWKILNQLYSELKMKDQTLKNGDETAKSEKMRYLLDHYNRYLTQEDSFLKKLNIERTLLAINSLRFEDVGNLKTELHQVAKKAAKKHKKKVQLIFNWERQFFLDKSTYQVFSECLTNLIQNSIEHGFEDPEARVQQGKSEIGTITISLCEDKNMLYCETSDDGAGIDFNKIRSLAIEKKLKPVAQLLEYTPDQLLGLVFTPGFKSPKNSPTDIGMGTIQEKVENMNGTIHIDTKPGEGTRITFNLELSFDVQIKKTCCPASSFGNYLIESIEDLNRNHGEQIYYKERELRKLFESGIVIGDQDALILAISTYLANIGASQELNINLTHSLDGLITVDIDVHGDFPQKEKLEFKLPVMYCDHFIHGHGGSLFLEKNSSQLKFGHLLRGDKLPEIVIALSSDISVEESETTINTVLDILDDIGVHPEFNNDLKIANFIISSTTHPYSNITVINVNSSKQVIQKEILQTINTLLGINTTQE